MRITKESKAYCVCDEIKTKLTEAFNEQVKELGLDFNQIQQTAEQSQNKDTLRLLALLQSLQSRLIGCQSLQAG
ncbi:MAG: hypothetical protein WC476_13555 [Phycisphaerae bacterium]|jgi:hypothetical protein